MKLRSNFLAAALLAVAAPVAMAQSTADIAISGTLVPGACTITLGNGGVADIGQIPTSALSSSGPTLRPRVTVPTHVVCTGPTVIALTATDNRAATLGPDFGATPMAYGMGLTTAGKPIGGFHLVMANPMVDGAPSSVVESYDLVTWIPLTPSAYWRKNNDVTTARYRAFGVPSARPVAVTTASFDLQVEPGIDTLPALALTTDAPVDGSATLEIIYL